MILITGMPRSGTSFLVYMFNDLGSYMTPKCISHMTSPWSSYEAEAVSYAYHNGVVGEKLVGLFKILPDVWKIPNDVEFIYKQPQLCFLKDELLCFNKIIMCERPVESWIKSALKYAPIDDLINEQTKPYWLKSFNDRLKKSSKEEIVSELGMIWHEKYTECLEFLKCNNKDVIVCRFGIVEDYKNLMSNLGLNDNFIDYYLKKNWAGSKTDSENYKPFS